MSKLSLTAAALAIAFTAGAQAKPAAAPAKPAAAPAAAPAQNQPIAGAVVGDVVQWKGVVMAVNPTTRHVVLKGPQGNLHSFTVKKDVTTLDQVKKGDTVTVDYVESIAIYLQEGTAAPMAAAASVRTVAPNGLPAVTDVAVKEAIAKITAVDQKTRSLTLVGPQGNAYTMTVDPSVTAFAAMKVGDQIVVRYTEAVAVKVTK
jgi:hypothetical protein